jgi:glycosyltransferase involved in cell wall biosynthesis
LKVLLVHNSYGRFSGEESVVDAQVRLLEDRGHEVLRFDRSSAELHSFPAVCKAFFTGIYNPVAAWRMRKTLRDIRPDIVHIHNLFPLISPAILPECRKARIPIVMTVHNYRLVCPSGLHLANGKVCEKCSGGREWWCVLRNCERNSFRSLGYALRNYFARITRLFLRNVTMYACLTEFQKRRLIVAGFPETRIAVVPNMCSLKAKDFPSEGSYVAFVGRLSPEKGVEVFLKSAKMLESIRFSVAGKRRDGYDIGRDAPSNVQLFGFLQGDALDTFRRQMRLLVMPSLWFETFGLILAEAGLYGKPVVASRLGAMAEIVEDGKTGLLFEPGNAEDLARKIKTLWDDPGLCRRMGEAGREKAQREYSPEKYYERLIVVYEKAIQLGPGGP